MTDPVDEWVVQALPEYDGKALKSAEKGDLDLEGSKKDEKKELSDLFEFIKTELEEKVKEVKPSRRLKDSVSCLSADSYDMSAYMEKIMKATGQDMPASKRVLELNTNHPVLQKLKKMYESDKNDPKLKEYSHLLYDLAVIGEGGKVENPSLFSKLVGGLLDNAL